ncbi:MAG: carbohydrate ABC transporter permease [Treponema sp.]|nr:carbohydrate ABC transporter permease [Treponema sp.]
MPNERKVTPIATALSYLVMGIFALLAIYPIFWLVIQSFKTTQEYMTASKLAFPAEWYPGNYPFVWQVGKFGMLLLNSVFYTVVSVASVVLLSLMAGFAFAKMDFKVTPFLHGLFIVGILITLQSILVPLFLMVRAVGLFNTRLGVLIPYVGLGLPMGVYLCTEFVKGIPGELVESARIDGSGYLRTFFSIILPMCAPVMASLGIISFTGTWNEFIIINVLTASDTLRTIPVGVARFAGSLATDFGRQFTGLVIGLVPILIFYAIFRNQITKGVAAGAVKG